MESRDLTKEYTNGETTVVWKPGLCVHSGICLMGLPGVFSLKRKPWIDMDAASTKEIETQVMKCPSGALSIAGKGKRYFGEDSNKTEIWLTPGGPATIFGPVSVRNIRGKETSEKITISLCRCGQSGNLPYCDGTHAKPTPKTEK